MLYKRMHCNRNEYIYLLAWVLMTFHALFIVRSEISSLYSWNKIGRAIQILASVLIVYKLLFCDESMEIRTMVIYGIVGGIAALVVYKAVGTDLLFQLILILGARKVEVRKIFKVDMILKISILLVLFLFGILGIIANYSATINGNYKMAFGWSHPNMFGSVVICVLMEWMYLSWKRLSVKYYMVIFVMILFLRKYSESRTQIYSFAVIIMLSIIIRIWPRIMKWKFIRFVIVCSMPALTALSLLMVALYRSGSSIGLKLDKLLTHRLAYSVTAFRTYGISLFGKKITFLSSRKAAGTVAKAFIIDMSYVRLFVVYGLIFACVFFLFYIIVLRKMLRMENYAAILFILYYALIGIASTTLLLLCFNVTPVLIWDNEKDARRSKERENK